MVTKNKLSTSELPLSAANDVQLPKGLTAPVGAGISLKGSVPTANSVTFDDSVDGQIIQNATVMMQLKKAVGAVSAYILSLVPIYVQNTGCAIYAGAGTPNGVVTAALGSIYLNTSGGANVSIYIKESGVGNTGWIGK